MSMTLRRHRLIVVALSAIALGACQLTINDSNTNTNNNNSAGGAGGGSGGNPNGPTPTPTPTTGGRTPDPAVGTTLPLPTYTASVVGGIPFASAQTCQSFAYLDAVVDALRARDTRWGYTCSSSGCASASLDKIAYHATAGPDTTGATGNWLVDLIVDVCGPFSRSGFDPSYDAVAGWSGRGRF